MYVYSICTLLNESKCNLCNLFKVNSEPLRTCLEGDNDIANAPRPTARCAKRLSCETSSILCFGNEMACREGIPDPKKHSWSDALSYSKCMSPRNVYIKGKKLFVK